MSEHSMEQHPDLVCHDYVVRAMDRAKQKNQKPFVVWFTGLSGSGKSTLANALDLELLRRHRHAYILDGDNVRHGLNQDLGFSDADRVENIRRIGEVSRLFVDAGLIVITAFISPFIEDRDLVRTMYANHEFIEVYVKASLSVCEKRDVKGLYKKARAGKIPNFTGIGSAYEAPMKPELVLDNEKNTVSSNTLELLNYLTGLGFI